MVVRVVSVKKDGTTSVSYESGSKLDGTYKTTESKTYSSTREAYSDSFYHIHDSHSHSHSSSSSSSSTSSNSNSSSESKNENENEIAITAIDKNTIAYDPNQVQRVYNNGKVVIKAGNQVLGIYDRSQVEEVPGKIIVKNPDKKYSTYEGDTYKTVTINENQYIINKKKYDTIEQTNKGLVLVPKGKEVYEFNDNVYLVDKSDAELIKEGKLQFIKEKDKTYLKSVVEKNNKTLNKTVNDTALIYGINPNPSSIAKIKYEERKREMANTLFRNAGPEPFEYEKGNDIVTNIKNKGKYVANVAADMTVVGIAGVVYELGNAENAVITSVETRSIEPVKLFAKDTYHDFSTPIKSVGSKVINGKVFDITASETAFILPIGVSGVKGVKTVPKIKSKVEGSIFHNSNAKIELKSGREGDCTITTLTEDGTLKEVHAVNTNKKTVDDTKIKQTYVNTHIDIRDGVKEGVIKTEVIEIEGQKSGYVIKQWDNINGRYYEKELYKIHGESKINLKGKEVDLSKTKPRVYEVEYSADWKEGKGGNTIDYSQLDWKREHERIFTPHTTSIDKSQDITINKVNRVNKTSSPINKVNSSTTMQQVKINTRTKTTTRTSSRNTINTTTKTTNPITKTEIKTNVKSGIKSFNKTGSKTFGGVPTIKPRLNNIINPINGEKTGNSIKPQNTLKPQVNVKAVNNVKPINDIQIKPVELQKPMDLQKQIISQASGIATSQTTVQITKTNIMPSLPKPITGNLELTEFEFNFPKPKNNNLGITMPGLSSSMGNSKNKWGKVRKWF